MSPCSRHKAITQLWSEHLSYPHHSPELASCDYYAFCSLKEALQGHIFTSSGEVKGAVQSLIQKQPNSFLSQWMRKVVKLYKMYQISNDTSTSRGTMCRSDITIMFICPQLLVLKSMLVLFFFIILCAWMFFYLPCIFRAIKFMKGLLNMWTPR